MKTYVTYWHCPKCNICLEYWSASGLIQLTATGPRCTECASQLRVDTGSLDIPVPRVIVEFK